MKLFSCLLSLGLLAGLMHGQGVTPQNTVVESEQFDWRSTDTETIAVFTGKVVATTTNQRLTCDRLEIIGTRKADSAATIGKIENFKSFVATGNVRIIQGDREAACGRAEVLPEQDRVILTENPVVVDHDQKTRISGEKITLLRGQRQVLVEKPTLVGPPAKDLGFDKDKKPAPAPAPAK
jgi:lipopolysaccharide export system protein LptA